MKTRNSPKDSKPRAAVWQLVVIWLMCSWCTATTLKVDLQGLPKAYLKPVQAGLLLYQAQAEPKLTPARIESLYARAPQDIQNMLQVFGYYHSQVSASQSQTDDQVHAVFKIELGAPTHIHNVQLRVPEADPKLARSLQRLLAHSLRQGDVFQHETYENTKLALLSTAAEYGYLNAYFSENVVNLDRNQRQAAIKLTLALENRFHFGRVTFHQNRYDTKKLRRYIPFHAGEPYTFKALAQLRENLEDADLFKKIRLDPSPDLSNPDNTEVPVAVRLVTKPFNHYSGSAGFGSDTGPRASLGWLHRRERYPGHRINLGLHVSNVRRLAEMRYSYPGRAMTKDRYTFKISAEREEVRRSFNQKWGLGGFLTKYRGSVKHTLGLELANEPFRLSDAEPKLYPVFLMPVYRIEWSSFDGNQASTTPRTQIDLELKAASKYALSSNNVLRGEITVRHGRTILTPRTWWWLRVTVGALSTEAFDQLPQNLRFYAGGDYSVRGFGYRQLGESRLDSEGNSVVIGGHYLMVFNCELEQQLKSNIGVAAFVDVGNALHNNFEQPLGVGTGVGLRYKTPIGDFKLDVAKPLNQSPKKHLRFHLTFAKSI